MSFPAARLTIPATALPAKALRRVLTRGSRRSLCIQAIDRLAHGLRLVLAIRSRQARGRSPGRQGNAGNPRQRQGAMMKNLLMSAAVFAALATPAHARLQLSIGVGASTFTCFDGQLSCDQSGGANNLLIVDQTVNGAFVQLALTQSQFGPVDELQLSTSNIENLTAAPLTITLTASDTDYTFPVSAINNSASLTFNSNIGAPNSTLTFFADTRERSGRSWHARHVARERFGSRGHGSRFV